MAPNTSLDRLSCICGGNGVHESATAVGPMLGLVRRLGDLIGPGFSLSAWALAEGFGEPYTVGSTDIDGRHCREIGFLIACLTLSGDTVVIAPGKQMRK